MITEEMLRIELTKRGRHWLRLLGNGVVPVAAAYAFASLWSVLEVTTEAR